MTNSILLYGTKAETVVNSYIGQHKYIQHSVNEQTVQALKNGVDGNSKYMLKNTNEEVSSSNYVHGSSLDSQGVTFKDPVLDSVVRKQLGKSTTDIISPEDMQGISYLNYDGFGSYQGKIKDLSGLEYATNLSNLYFYYNEITDLSPLQNLTKLSNLSLSNNQITDLAPLQNLTGLSSLNLTNNRVTDITPIKGLTGLMYLSIGNNKITDMSPLSSMTNLDNLNIDNTGLSSIDFIKNMKSLTCISLSCDPITDYTPLESFNNLISLGLNGCKLNSNPGLCSFISGLSKLQYLSISNNYLSNISFIEKLTSLQNLYADNNCLTDIKSIITNVNNGGFAANASNNYRSIVISSNNLDITSASDVYNDIKSLKSKGINVSYGYQKNSINTTLLKQYPKDNSIGFAIDGSITFDLNKNISKGQGFSNITLNDSDNNPVNIDCTIEGSTLTIKPNSNLSYNGRYTLNIPYGAITDDIGTEAYIPSLTFTTEPQYITFNDTNLANAIYASLKKNTNITKADMDTLKELSIENSGVSDLSGLQYASNLEKLSLGGNSINDISVLENLNKLTYLDLKNNAITDISPLSELTNLAVFNLSGNKIKDILPILDCARMEGLKGANVDISNNYLDLSEQSLEMNYINSLINMGISVTYNAQNVDKSPATSIELLLQDAAHSSNISERGITVSPINDYSIYPEYNITKNIEQTSTGYLIDISGIDWGDNKKIKVCVNTDADLYLMDVDASEAGKQVVLTKDTNSTKLNLNIETANKAAFIPNVINCYRDNGSGKYYYAGEMHMNESIPYGNYAFQIIGNDDQNDYDLFKENVDISSSSNTISINRNDYAALKANFDNLTYNPQVSYFNAGMQNSAFCYTYSCGFQNKGCMYLIKGNYDSIGFGTDVSSQDKEFTYFYDTPQIQLDNDVSLNIGTQLTSKIEFGKDNYKPHESTGNFIAGIYDQFGNRIMNMYNGSNDLPGIVEFIQQGKVIKAIDTETYFSYFSKIFIPDLNGSYDVAFDLKDGILPISAEKTTLTINGSDEPLIISAKPDNGAVEIKCSDPITINYSKNIASGDGFGNITLNDAAGNSVSISVSISESVLTISPQNKLDPNTKYTLIIPDNAVKSLNGTLAKGCTIEFTTVNYGVLTNITKQNPDDSDAQAMENILTGGAEATSDQLNAADLDGDGKITSADYALLKRYLKGKIKSLPCN